MTDCIGLYVHIPFCKSKCGYCDFYSFVSDESAMNRYLDCLLKRADDYAAGIKRSIDTIYIGGGTPSVFGGERIRHLLERLRSCFAVTSDCEITVECNPSSVDEPLVKTLKAAGVNRISMGLQSAVTSERKSLGRLSDSEQAKRAVRLFQESGFENLSLDLMLGLENQTLLTLDESLDFILSLDVKHVSAYLLKLEEGTPLFERRNSLSLPDEDAVCQLYLHTVNELAKHGIVQYEISNFARPGFESRHNLKYWNDEEYLGLGPGAHSFLDGRRFYFERDFAGFLKGNQPITDGLGGGEEEYIMLRLRLKDGLRFDEYKKRYQKEFPERIIKKAEELKQYEVLICDKSGIRLTEKGFLLSNSVIAGLLS